jgi:hypothetical protein
MMVEKPMMLFMECLINLRSVVMRRGRTRNVANGKGERTGYLPTFCLSGVRQTESRYSNPAMTTDLKLGHGSLRGI